MGIGPLLLFFLIQKNTQLKEYYKIILVFIRTKYTFVYTIICIFIITLTVTNMNFGLYSTVVILITRFFRLTFLYDNLTISLLHQIFCCRSTTKWTRAKVGGAISAGLTAAANTEVGKQCIGMVQDAFLNHRQDVQVDRAIKMNDDFKAAGAYPPAQHSKIASEIMAGQVRRASSVTTTVLTSETRVSQQNTQGFPDTKK